MPRAQRKKKGGKKKGAARKPAASAATDAPQSLAPTLLGLAILDVVLARVPLADHSRLSETCRALRDVVTSDDFPKLRRTLGLRDAARRRFSSTRTGRPILTLATWTPQPVTRSSSSQVASARSAPSVSHYLPTRAVQVSFRGMTRSSLTRTK